MPVDVVWGVGRKGNLLCGSEVQAGDWKHCCRQFTFREAYFSKVLYSGVSPSNAHHDAETCIQCGKLVGNVGKASARCRQDISGVCPIIGLNATNTSRFRPRILNSQSRISELEKTNRRKNTAEKRAMLYLIKGLNC